MPEHDWPRVAVMGAGAVGCYFGGMLARAGAPVTLIGRPAHVEAIARDGLFIDSLNFQGRVKHVGRGDLVLGEVRDSTAERPSRRDEVAWVADVFGRAGVPCRVVENFEGELWTKMIMNCAWNAISALARSAYGRLGRNPLGADLILSVTREAMAVAQAAGVRLPEIDLPAAVLKLRETMAEATSSTAQDIARGKRTEIDSLNGYLARRGAELGVPAPVNATLHALVRLLENAA